MTSTATTMRRVIGVVAATAVTLLTAVTPAGAAPSTAAVVGTITGPSGEVLPGVRVTAYWFGAPTTSDGRYRVSSIPAGTTVTVCAYPPPELGTPQAPTGYLRKCAPSFVAAARSTTTVDLRLGVGAAMSGRAVDDRTGRPIGPGSVFAESRYPDGSPSKYYAVVTRKSDGSWVVRGLKPGGHWFVTAYPNGTSTDAPFGWGGAQGTDAPYVLTAGVQRKGVTLRQKPLTEIAVSATAPSGNTIIVEAGDPADGGDRELGFDGDVITLHPTARYGTATGPGVVCAYGYSAPADPLGYAFQCTTVAFSATQQSQLSLAMVIGGAVRGAITGSTRTDAVWVEVNGHRVVGHLDDSSNTAYSLGNLPTGRYVVHASDPDGETGQSAPVDVVQGQITSGASIILR